MEYDDDDYDFLVGPYLRIIHQEIALQIREEIRINTNQWF